MGLIREVAGATWEIATFAPTIIKMARNPSSPEDVDDMARRFAEVAQQYPDRPAIVFEGRAITYGELDRRISQVARTMMELGVARGDCVSLFMENRIEFVECLFGLARAGARTALINTNLRGPQLIHCINTTDSRKIVLGSELADAIAEIKAECPFHEGRDFLWVADGDTSASPNWCVDLGERIAQAEPISPDQIPGVQRKEQAVYIFTSGTTGMPKAAIQKHGKLVESMVMGSKIGLKFKPSDRFYICLPLYHGTGLLVGFLPAIYSGSCVVLRRKFSASQFLAEVREFKCNSFIYIGEMCRYLMAQPERPDDADNPIVKCVGNGLRPDIWMAFKKRFGIKRIFEFYASSEGNTGFWNLFNRDQTVGVAMSPPAMVQYDVLADEVVRGADGFCKRSNPGEPGLLLGPISERSSFEGYTDRQATEEKILRNVFEEGDAYFNTGDLMREVDAGFAFGMKHYQFVDRVGDTFRWKGENCSTNEVGEIINRHPSVHLCNVYGVTIPGTDGRAGMAALLLRQDAQLDLHSLSALIHRDLASYARPVFLRVLSEVKLTGTFKLVKGDLREQAYHPEKCPDPLYVLKPGSSGYEPLDEHFYARILAREAGF